MRITNLKVQAVSDAFDQGAVNSALWTSATDIQGGTTYGAPVFGTASVASALTAVVSSGISMSVPANLEVPALTCASTGVGSTAPYDLTDSGISVRLVSVPGHQTGVSTQPTALFCLTNNTAYPSNVGVAWQLWYEGGSGGTVIAPTYWNPSLNYPGSADPATYDSDVHRFLRIVENAGTVYWDYSPDGLAWTTEASMVDPFDLTSLYINVYGTSETSVGYQWGGVGYSLATS